MLKKSVILIGDMAVVIGLRAHEIDIVIIIPETAGIASA